MNTLIEKNKTIYSLLLSANSKEPVFKFVVNGAASKDFVFPNGDVPFEATKITLDNIRDKTSIDITKGSNSISVSELWFYLEDMEDSGTLGYVSIERILSAFNLSWINLVLTKEYYSDCDCCGNYSIKDFKVENLITKSSVKYSDNTHFYSGQLPNMNELMSFIVDK